MIGTLLDTIASSPPQELKALVKLMGIAVQDAEYRLLVNNELTKFPEFQSRKALLESGFFSGRDFSQLVLACGDGSGANLQILTSMLHQLKDWMLVDDIGLLLSNGYVRYKWKKERIALFIALRILDNIVLGPTYVAQKYQQSVPPIFVKKGEDEYTGTGFIATNRADAKKHVIVTARHNVDPHEGIAFRAFGLAQGVSYSPLATDWLLHPKLDLAVMPVECSESPIPIYPVGRASVLSRTISLGYPRIATTDAPYLLAHGGELNAIVTTYYGEERLIISNVVAPGNSGGPVLNEAGLCVGMVVNAFETAHEGGVSTANAAIPSNAIFLSL